MKRKFEIGIIGNPNCGKTTLFNMLTGGRQQIGNWPGVTVDRKSGRYVFEEHVVTVLDLPGIYSLSSLSLDEQIARDYIIKDTPDLIVNIVDASNLERNLYLTVQLLEMKVPVIVVLNMVDIVKQQKTAINYEQLSFLLDCPVVCTVANKGEGVQPLKQKIHAALDRRHISKANIYFPEELEAAIDTIKECLRSDKVPRKIDYRWAAVKLLEGGIDIPEVAQDIVLSETIKKAREAAETILGEEPDVLIAEARYGFVNSVCKRTVDKSNIIRKNISDAIDRVVLDRFLGIPIFIFAMYIMFWITINFGGCFIDFFDILCGTVFVDGLGSVLTSIGTPELLNTILAHGVGGGIQTIATFIPPIFFMFFSLALLEDSGYMARAAFIMDRLMRAIGLPGKAFVPLLVGFGCNVPAIMATRTLSNEKDRTLTVMMNPFMSCGARMPVYAVFAAAFFPENGGNIIFLLYIIGIALAIMTAFILKSTVLRGDVSTFIMELPAYHIPTLKGILIHTWNRLKGFIVRAGRAILLVVIVLNVINAIGADGSFGHANTEKSIISVAGKKIVPIFKPMGMTEDNWPAAVGIVMGVFAKEAVIGTLDAIYTQSDSQEIVGEEHFSFSEGIQDAFNSVPRNIAGLELPFSVAGLLGADISTTLEDTDVSDVTYAGLRKRFDGKAGAFAYLLMILLYMPCVAAIAAVYRELNLGWTLFSIMYLSGLAWICSTLFYQIVRFRGLSSLGWIAGCVSALAIFIFGLRLKAHQDITGT